MNTLWTLFAMPAAALAVMAVAVTPTPQAKPSAANGAALYKAQCAGCHGANGEGAKGYPKPLIGSKQPVELASFIAKSMPPGPKKATPADAQKIAGHIYDAFYSPIAQERNRPARVQLSRLTVRQFRNTVFDLVASFRPSPKLGDQQGLQASYYKLSRPNPRERVLQRIDPEINLQLGPRSAVEGQDDPYQFSMRWEGSVIAPDTGEYEIIVHSEHAVRFWLNDMQIPLLDGYVKSGDVNEYSAGVFLLGGRAYPLRLEYSKGVQGVNNINEVKKKPPQPSSVVLMWKRPKLAREVIPARCLRPVTTAEGFAPAAPFPPDDRSIGYERGTTVSKTWDEAVTNAALETAGYISGKLREFIGPPEAADRQAKASAFCRQFVERAFRRPLDDETARLYVDRQLAAAPDIESGVRRVVAMALKSPRFLYREAPTGGDQWDTASRLSYILWDTMPDADLAKAAATGQLQSAEQVTAQAERMLSDPRAWYKVREFLWLWLKLDHVPEIVKDEKRYAGFDAAAALDLRTSMDLFLEKVVWGDESDYRRLLTSQTVYLNGRLARLYGADLPENAPFTPVELDRGERSGVLTQPYLLAAFAYLNASSPIHRGVLIARNVLGRNLQPPQAAFAPLSPDLHPNLTTRQRVELQTKPEACSTCHSMINPLGFTLEMYDAVGRLRKTDNGKPVDTTGSYTARNGRLLQFKGARDFAQYLANSDECHAAFVEKLFQNLVKQPILAYGARTSAALQRTFADNAYNIRKLVVQIASAAANPAR
jgi:mono/diheme cytochrome c family protein